MRRRRNKPMPTVIQDPGKDLFAYLFLLIMVFSFMLLMSTEERREHLENQTAPENRTSTSSTIIAKVDQEQLGRLLKNDQGIFLAFGGELYDPEKDIARLKSDNRILSKSEGSEEGISLLYLVEERNSQVLLAEYLSAFQKLGSQGIRVAFAERVR